MANLWQKTLFYLGLVDEDEAQTYESPARAYSDQSYGDTGHGYSGTQPGTAPGPDPAVRRRPVPDPRRVTAQSQVPEDPRGFPGAGGGVVGRRVEPPLTTRRRTSADQALSEAGVIVRGSDTPSVRTISDADMRTEIIVARSYSDAQALADHIRSASPVVLDLRKVEPAMVRRLVDFASGLTYALGGSMRKIGQGVILVTPANVNITRDERARLAEMGYYQASES
ncbi:MAG: cell division protein SepF [Acidimicrobiia bacterium]|nr:cell division protein SepF [Acidimicrobiia bacterium]